MANKYKTIENLKRLINHPATPDNERVAAIEALNRVLGLDGKDKASRPKVTTAQLFRRSMRRYN